MKEHIATEHKIAYLKQKLETSDTSIKMRLEILGLFMSFYTTKEFNILEFFKELDRLVEFDKLYKGRL